LLRQEGETLAAFVKTGTGQLGGELDRQVLSGLPGLGDTGFERSIISHEDLMDQTLRSGFGSTFKHEATAVPTYESLVKTQPGNLPVPYKVLTSEGLSPGAHSVRWSLPELQPNGQWRPGEWLNVEQTPENAYSINGELMPQTRRALHVSNAPGQWSLGQHQMRVFQAELSPADQAHWQEVAKTGTHWDQGSIPVSLRDFPAREMRLTRELFGKELQSVVSSS
jgi:hypothetical protein